MKRGQITIFVIIAIILVVGVGVSVFLKSDSPKLIECETDSDCVPSTCCHATSCAPVGDAPDCSQQICTLNCEPQTLDCGYGGCSCVNNKCSVHFNEE